MTALSHQMQARMTVRLNELRGKVMTQMKGAGERIKSRPSLPGDKSLEKVSNHLIMKQNDDGATILGAAIGIPGLDGIAETAIDVATELYGDRKAVHERPQDRTALSPKAEACIRDQNEQDLKLFQSLDEKLNFLDSAISCGSVWAMIDTQTDELFIIDDIETPKYIMDKKPEISEEGLSFFASLQANRAVGMHLN